MYPRYSGRGWNALTRNQKIGVIIAGILVLFAIFASRGGGGFLGRLGNPSWILAAAAIVFVAFPIHEMAHAATAVSLGDPTPRRQGRYTLNPLPHIDPMGAILILLTGFGWAKPVSWDPRNIDVDRRLGAILVALAGPVSNLVLAAILIFVIDLLPAVGQTIGGPAGRFFLPGGFIFSFFEFFIYINVLLFVFNLIPIPPLDGSHILFALLPNSAYELRLQLSRYGFLVLFILIFFIPSIILAPTQAILEFLVTLVGA